MSGWIKIPDNWVENNKVEDLGAEAVMLHLSALSLCSRQASDGDVPTRALRRLWPCHDLEAAVKELVEAEEWQVVEDGWHLPNWNVHLLSASEVEHRRQVSRASSERFRRHKAGDHSLCERCSVVRGDKSRDTSPHTSVTPLDSQRLDSPRSDSGEGRREEESGARTGSAGATPARAREENDDLRCPHGNPKGLLYRSDSLVCGECESLAPDNLDFIPTWREALEAEGLDINEVDDAVSEKLTDEQTDTANFIAHAVYARLVPAPFNDAGHRADVESFIWITFWVIDQIAPNLIASCMAGLQTGGRGEFSA